MRLSRSTRNGMEPLGSLGDAGLTRRQIGAHSVLVVRIGSQEMLVGAARVKVVVA
jgi:hypothetical protein